MMRLAWIAWRQIVTQATRPRVLVAALATPVLIAALVHLSFGDLVLGQDMPERRAPVGIVNSDQGGAWGNLGQAIVRALIPSVGDTALPAALQGSLFEARAFADEAQARRLVERGRLAAALFIPPDFSDAVARQQAGLQVYVYGGEDLVGGAFAVVVATLADALASGEIAVRTTVSALQEQPRTRALLRAGALNDALADLAVTAVLPTSSPVRIRRVALEGQPPGISLAHYVAVAIAIMFSGLTALLGCASLYQEKAQRTLQRTYLTPTPPWVVLVAQALATYALGVAQMLVLVGGLAALEAVAGHGQARVGRLDLLGLGGLALAEVAAATGLGVVIAGLCGSYARAANYGRAALVLMGLVGGIFFPANLLPAPWTWLSRALYQYWAMEGYLRLARGGDAASVLTHMLVMAGMGALFLAVGSALVRRRLAYS